ncbi:microtubule-associated protein 1B-like [Saccostrea cucullata]|uniref:microtubule-associated protein 1B-like n=1 Tax=Saccostrea cuccullata TaxID=36930 RepID=UPI002ED1E550
MESTKKQCEHEYDTPVCVKCILSSNWRDSQLELLSDICDSLGGTKKEKIRADLLDLEENIGPKYDSNLGEVEALLSKIIKQHKDRKNVILELGDELHKVVDLVINKYLSEAGKMEKEDVDFVQSIKSKFKLSTSEIKAAIKECREFLATDNNKKLAKYKSKNSKFKNMPTRYELSVSRFQPHHLTEEKLCQIVGSLQSSVRKEIKAPENNISDAEPSLIPSPDVHSPAEPMSKVSSERCEQKKSKADRLSELNDLMDSISQATKDMAPLDTSPKVTKKLSIPKEFNSKIPTSQRGQKDIRSKTALEVECPLESKTKPSLNLNGHVESSAESPNRQSSPLVSSVQAATEHNGHMEAKSDHKSKSEITVSIEKSLEIDIPAASTLKPSKPPNSEMDPKIQMEQRSTGEYSKVTTELNVPLNFQSKATAELAKESPVNLHLTEKLNDLTSLSPSGKKEVKTPVESSSDVKSELMSFAESTSNATKMANIPSEIESKPRDVPDDFLEASSKFANVPKVTDIFETGYTYTYKIACARSTNQIFICGNNKVIKQMNSAGKFVEKTSTDTGNQPFDLTLTRDAQLIFSDHNGKCINLVKNNGRIESLVKLQKWFPMAICSTSVDDLLVTMESQDLATCKVVRYSGSTVKQEIQYDVRGEQLYCRADFIDENKNLDVVVSDLGARRIVVVDKYGIFRFNYTGNLQSERYKSFGCSGVTTDTKSNIIVADEYNDVLHVIDQNGQFLMYIDNCKLQRPGDLCTDSDDVLYVTEPVANKVKKIKFYN